MAKIIYRVPSKVTQYGYVEIERTQPDDEPTDPQLLAAAYVSYVYAFQKEEQEALKRLSEGLKQGDPRDSVGDPHKAAVEAIKDGLGATEMAVDESTTPPWDRPQQAAPKKPWEVDGVTGPAILDALGDDW
jgi:hypothetical protein